MAPDAEPAAPIVAFKRRGAKAKANIRRPATPPPASSDSNSDSSDGEAGRPSKRRKKTTTVQASSRNPATQDRDLSATTFSADRSAPISSGNDATKASNWYEEDAKDTLSAKSLLGTARAPPADGTYKGLANQTSFIQKRPDAPSKTVGPVKASTNVRTITITDFAPDVCKDYKQTGFCGFGDNCKYLHIREDFKQGWQLDKDWETVSKGKKNMGGTVVADASRSLGADGDGDDEENEEDLALLENIPFKCIICEDSYKAPIVTRCGHYFCEPCALKRYRKNPKCAACSNDTGGVFNSATRLKKLLERKRERAAKRRQKALEAGEEVSDEEES